MSIILKTEIKDEPDDQPEDGECCSPVPMEQDDHKVRQNDNDLI